jgi:hypothetical protein
MLICIPQKNPQTKVVYFSNFYFYTYFQDPTLANSGASVANTGCCVGRKLKSTKDVVASGGIMFIPSFINYFTRFKMFLCSCLKDSAVEK